MDNVHNILDRFKRDIILYISNNSAFNIIKTNKENLNKCGDFSFPIKHFLWHEQEFYQNFYDPKNVNCNIFECRFKRKFNSNYEAELLVKNSAKWCIPIRKVEITNERCFIFLDRKFVLNLVINQIVTNRSHEHFDIEQKNSQECAGPLHMNLFAYRKHLIKLAIKNILQFHHKITNIDSRTLDDLEKVKINCGLVMDSKTKKRATLNLHEYQQLRLKDMQLVSMHKYGTKPRGQDYFDELLMVLGDFAVKVDLLEIKSKSPVNIVRNGYGSTKGAAFIMYNAARLDTLLRNFDKKIKSGNYPPLPPISEIDFSVLNEEEEWQICMGYILQFYTVLQRCLAEDVNNGYSVHFLIQYLQGLVSVFSIYYRKTRILTERRHLISTVYARIYFLKAIQTILTDTLFILNVEPVKYM